MFSSTILEKAEVHFLRTFSFIVHGESYLLIRMLNLLVLEHMAFLILSPKVLQSVLQHSSLPPPSTQQHFLQCPGLLLQHCWLCSLQRSEVVIWNWCNWSNRLSSPGPKPLAPNPLVAKPKPRGLGLTLKCCRPPPPTTTHHPPTLKHEGVVWQKTQRVRKVKNGPPYLSGPPLQTIQRGLLQGIFLT